MRWSRRGAWLTAAGVAAVVTAGALLVAFVLVPPAPPAQEARFVAAPPPPPPEVLAAATGNAPAPSADGVHEAIDALVRDPALGQLSALVVDAVTGERLYAHEPDRPAVPASTTKLVTGVAVLVARGPAYQIPTIVVAGEQPGEVVLVGGGDPTLAVNADGFFPGAARLDDLAEQVAQAWEGPPITQVTVDASLFEGPVQGPWDSSIVSGGFVGPVTALMTDAGRIDPDPAHEQRPAARFPEPDLAAGEAFAELLGVDAEVTRGEAPPGAAPASPGSGGEVAPGTELGRVLSPTIQRLVETMVIGSDNVLAEALARQVALARGEPASYAGAAAATTEVLAELGLSIDTLADGSGLSRDNRLTPAQLTDLLTTVLADRSLTGLVAGLPVAGWSGTLADRYRSPQPDTGPGAGVVRAKTGSLGGVSTLAGLVVTADGRLLTFALMANDAPFEAPNGLDRIAATLATCGCS